VKPEQRLGCSGRRRKDLDVVWGCSEKKKIVMVCAAANLGFFKPYEAILPRLFETEAYSTLTASGRR